MLCNSFASTYAFAARAGTLWAQLQERIRLQQCVTAQMTSAMDFRQSVRDKVEQLDPSDAEYVSAAGSGKQHCQIPALAGSLQNLCAIWQQAMQDTLPQARNT